MCQALQKKHNKNSFSFKITVSCGYDEAYRKKRHYKVWKAPEGWSEQRAEREAQRIAFEFEKAIKQGYQPDNRKTFAEYAAYVIDLKEHTVPSTVRFSCICTSVSVFFLQSDTSS